ncbi:GTP 3',8-cyclase MoaA [Alphaproteobacteria bacterium]|nr:GTP 3',8-cyclase MoaA [Alphaproteobacteria bacterium]
MIDPYLRNISYLRLSVTDRCDLRCTYCMPEDNKFLPKTNILSLEEIERLATVFIKKGIKKIRITGGEPLVRKNVIQLFNNLGKFLKTRDLDELTLTTNATQLSKFAKPLFESGVRRINVSLDSLNPDKINLITRKNKFDSIMKGIFSAAESGMKIKINAVALKGINDNDFEKMLHWCGQNKFDLTLIETMPMGNIGYSRNKNYISVTEVINKLEKKFHFEKSSLDTGGPAKYLKVKEYNIKLGLITPMSHNFCSLCNRIRVTCTGKLYMCLGQNNFVDLKLPMRGSKSNNLLEKTIDNAINKKPFGHDFSITPNFESDYLKRTMNVTGG